MVPCEWIDERSSGGRSHTHGILLAPAAAAYCPWARRKPSTCRQDSSCNEQGTPISHRVRRRRRAAQRRAGTAFAQPVATGLALDRFDPAERGSEWFVLDTLDLRGRVRPAIGADFDWGHKPLVLYDANDHVVGIGGRAIRSSFTSARRSCSGIDFASGSTFRSPIVQSGDGATLAGVTYPAPTSPEVGDLRLGADVRLVGRVPGAPSRSRRARACTCPRASRTTTRATESCARSSPTSTPPASSARSCTRPRSASSWRRSEIVGGVRLGDDFQFGAAAGVRLASGKLVLGPELYGSTVVEGGAFRTAATPLEALLGLHYQFVEDWRFGVGFGPGHRARRRGAPLSRGGLDRMGSRLPPPRGTAKTRTMTPSGPAERATRTATACPTRRTRAPARRGGAAAIRGGTAALGAYASSSIRSRSPSRSSSGATAPRFCRRATECSTEVRDTSNEHPEIRQRARRGPHRLRRATRGTTRS